MDLMLSFKLQEKVLKSKNFFLETILLSQTEILFDRLEYDLKNASILASKFNATFDEVWHYAAIVQSYCDKCITLCVTINVPQVDQPRQGEHVIFIATSINSPGMLIMVYVFFSTFFKICYFRCLLF